jgi:hypothetical protein
MISLISEEVKVRGVQQRRIYSRLVYTDHSGAKTIVTNWHSLQSYPKSINDSIEKRNIEAKEHSILGKCQRLETRKTP